jgi:hypothetical protein
MPHHGTYIEKQVAHIWLYVTVFGQIMEIQRIRMMRGNAEHIQFKKDACRLQKTDYHNRSRISTNYEKQAYTQNTCNLKKPVD